jgi:hypothetical protein
VNQLHKLEKLLLHCQADEIISEKHTDVDGLGWHFFVFEEDDDDYRPVTCSRCGTFDDLWTRSPMYTPEEYEYGVLSYCANCTDVEHNDHCFFAI